MSVKRFIEPEEWVDCAGRTVEVKLAPRVWARLKVMHVAVSRPDQLGQVDVSVLVQPEGE